MASEIVDTKRLAKAAVRSTEGLAETIAYAAEFLLDRQRQDGTWRDFRLEPGESDAWITSYVGLALAPLESDAAIGAALTCARSWVAGAMRPQGDWGYNSRTPPDCDSTAHAILFLASGAQAAPTVSLARVLSFQRRDGGFSTFQRRDPHDSWGHSHVDVSPVVLEALRMFCDPIASAAMVRGVNYLLNRLRPAGNWESFWWNTPLYATAANVRCLEALGVDYSRSRVGAWCAARLVPAHAFEQALLLETISRLEPAGDSSAALLAGALIALQKPDGSFEPHAMLRVTAPDVAEPWDRLEGTAGPVAKDETAVFTTATALRGLLAYAAVASGASKRVTAICREP
jgi:hypothetical protein